MKKQKKYKQLKLDDFMPMHNTTQTTLDDFGLTFVPAKKKNKKKFVQTTLDDYE